MQIAKQDRPLIALLLILILSVWVFTLIRGFFNVADGAAWLGFSGNVAGGLLAGLVAVLLFLLERRNERARADEELNRIRTLLRSEVGIIALQCMKMCNGICICLINVGYLDKDFVHSCALNPMTVYPSVLGRIADLTVDESVALISFAGEVADAKSLSERILKRPFVNDDYVHDCVMLRDIFARICMQAAIFISSSETGQTGQEIALGRRFFKSLQGVAVRATGKAWPIQQPDWA